jgi:hypothetical protein
LIKKPKKWHIGATFLDFGAEIPVLKGKVAPNCHFLGEIEVGVKRTKMKWIGEEGR